MNMVTFTAVHYLWYLVNASIVKSASFMLCKSICALYKLYKMHQKMVMSCYRHPWQYKSHNHTNVLSLDLIMKAESSQEQDDCESKHFCYCCFCVKSNENESKTSRPSSQQISTCFKVQKSTMFALQAFVVWVVLCLPGNIVTIILYQKANSLMHQVSYAFY